MRKKGYIKLTGKRKCHSALTNEGHTFEDTFKDIATFILEDIWLAVKSRRW